MSTTDLTKIAARMREQLRDQNASKEAQRQERARIEEENRQAEIMNGAQELQVLGLIDGVVAALNAQSPESLLVKEIEPGLDVAYHFGARKLNVHFFQLGELYDNPSVPGRMNTLRTHHAVHGGYIKIQEHGKDRQGWNFVLVRRPDAEVGQWLVVETDFHALNGRYARYPPFATQARVFADNLACHWDNMMHVYVLEDRPLERADIVRILDVLSQNT